MAHQYEFIEPMAFTLEPELTQEMYYLAFPAEWKRGLLEIQRKYRPSFKDEYGLPTYALEKMIISWLEGIISLSPLRANSQDGRWLTSCRPYDRKTLEMLCGIIRNWAAATYITPKSSPAVRKMTLAFCDNCTAERLKADGVRRTVCLTAEDGTVCGEAYKALPLLAASRLQGAEIVINSEKLRLCSSGDNELISLPLEDPKTRHQYSYVFNFSVQTVPPRRRALLLCHISTRRWVYDRDRKREPFLKEAVNVHILLPDAGKFCRIPAAYNRETKRAEWKEQEKKCYNLQEYTQLPEAEDLIKSPLEYRGQFLIPYKNGMNWAVQSKIGTGVSQMDKAALWAELEPLLAGIAESGLKAGRVKKIKMSQMKIWDGPAGYKTREEFREWVRQCTETDRIVFELYGLWKDPGQRQILEQLENVLREDFGENPPESCLTVEIVHRESGELADALPNDAKNSYIERSAQIREQLGTAKAVTACLFVLPGADAYRTGDPKQALRNAFACTSRVVQFITPETADEEDEEDKMAIESNKARSAVYDVYRQLGIAFLPNLEKLPGHPLAKIPCAGMHIFTQVHGIAGKGRFLPISVTADLSAGRIRVQCDAFEQRAVSYREACFELARLFWKPELEKLCTEACRSPAKSKLIQLKNYYPNPEQPVLVLVQADGNSRALWSGISDKEIGGYQFAEEYCPKQINVGTAKNPSLYALGDSGVRIVRVRSNQEVPDYITPVSAASTEEKLKYASVSGVFQYEDTFWSILAKPNDKKYNLSLTSSRTDYPRRGYAEKDMAELYPLQLQPGDHAADWVFAVNALRHLPLQYRQSTVLPLPLHLAKGLEEYLFNI